MQAARPNPKIGPWRAFAAIGLAAAGVGGIVMGERARRRRLRERSAPERLSSAAAREDSGYGGLSRQAMQTIQTQLRTLGYDPGKIDGLYGDLTAAAVAAFQTDAGLGVDGKPGPVTRQELAARVQAKGEDLYADCDPLTFNAPLSMCTYDEGEGRWVVVTDEAAMEELRQQAITASQILGASLAAMDEAKRKETPPFTTSEDLGFSRDGTEIVGNTGFYMLRVLEPWLQDRVRAGELVTSGRPDLAEAWEDRQGAFIDRTTWTWGQVILVGGVGIAAAPYSLAAMAGGLGKAYVDYLHHADVVSETHREAMENTALAATARYLQTAKVRTPDGPVLIGELPNTDARNDLIRQIAARVGYFQQSN